MNNRCDFVFLFDVTDGNPNGDPDSGNLPRVDPETGAGLITDVCLKRKIRNYVSVRHNEVPPFDIYVKEKAVLIRAHEKAYEAIGVDLKAKEAGKRKGSASEVEQARSWMCRQFYDVRAFGAVMSLGVNCGQLRGPVQLTFARSIGRVTTLEHSITRMAVATEGEAEKQQGDNRTMGRKFTIPYGLYRTHGFINASLATQTNFGDADLELLWEALLGMFEHDRSAARGQMAPRKLVLFRHTSKLGNAPAHVLQARVVAVPVDPSKPARTYKDFNVSVDRSNLTTGVELLELL